MIDLENIYLKLPITLQNIICSLEGLRIKRSRFGGDFLNAVNLAKERISWPLEKIIDYRDTKLQNFVNHAVKTTSYYKEKFQELKISPNDIKTIADLKILPILTKQEVQDNYPKMVSNQVENPIITHTSGTTGGGLRFATTLEATQEQWAIWTRYRLLHNINLNTWCGYFGGRSIVNLSQNTPPFWRFNYPGKQILFSAYHMNEENLPFYIKVLENKQPPWLHGYPSLISLLANYLIEKKHTLKYQPKVITIGAENLLPQQVSLIEKAFGIKPKQHYGMAEAIANFSECEIGNLHVDEDFAAVEFIPLANNLFKIIGTNFTNLATPLIRYDVGDIVSLSDKCCVCSFPGRVIDSVDGRKEDYIILKNGSKLGRMDHIFKDLVNIKEAQIYQKHIGEITLRIVKGSNYTTKDEILLLEETKKRVGNDSKISLEYLDKLARSKTGKLRFVISEIEQAKIDRYDN
jgi:phenylacetate-CoA ligase